MNTRPELYPDATSYYLTIISILRWMIELERIDIITKVLLLLPYIACPGEGQLEAAMHVMTHNGQRYNSRFVYDSSYPEIDLSIIKKYG